MSSNRIGIDIGGTSIKLGLFSNMDDLLTKWEIPTDKSNGAVNIVKDINETVRKKLTELNLDIETFKGAGLGVPGFVDSKRGVIQHSPNIKWIENYPLQIELEGLLNLPVSIENDANLATIGEMSMGAAKGKKNILMVTLGTGVGGGVIVNGEIVGGVNGMGGEIGHIFAKENNILCGCGKYGCLETIASATGITRMGNEMIEYYSDSTSLYDIEQSKGKIEAKDVIDEAKKGDELSLDVVTEAMKQLGIALSHIIHTNNPEAIIIGGGLSKAGDFLLEIIKEQVRKYTLPRAFKAIEFSLPTLGNDAGIIGGAYLVENR